jgi:hypothetical protein
LPWPCASFRAAVEIVTTPEGADVADILTGVGGAGPAPLAQFAFLLGVTDDWGEL